MKKSACWTLCILLAGSSVAWGQTASARNTLQNRQQAALMAEAFALAVKAGRAAYVSGLPEQRPLGNASSPLTGFLYDHDPA